VTSTESVEATWAAPADLTAKARIRNAALELHAAKGEASTTIREVANAAGVTHGLVVHHFTNKKGLRRAVQQYVIDLLRQALDAVPTEGTAAAIGRARDASVDRMLAEHPAVQSYLRRALLDPADIDTELIAMLADFTLAQVRDLRARGVASSKTPDYAQAVAILMRELGPRLLVPVAEHFWAHLSDQSAGPTPRLDVRLQTTSTAHK
jgi:TetR/AcrR family transcriptional regulator, regulator of cefoperazone and chloramphenicol sensitivity